MACAVNRPARASAVAAAVRMGSAPPPANAARRERWCVGRPAVHRGPVAAVATGTCVVRGRPAGESAAVHRSSVAMGSVAAAGWSALARSGAVPPTGSVGAGAAMGRGSGAVGMPVWRQGSAAEMRSVLPNHRPARPVSAMVPVPVSWPRRVLKRRRGRCAVRAPACCWVMRPTAGFAGRRVKRGRCVPVRGA